MIKWFLFSVKKNYLNFNGRASRSEFLNFLLSSLLIIVALFALLAITGTLATETSGTIAKLSSILPAISIILFVLIGIALVPAFLSVTVRRLHDIGKGGLWIFVALIPAIGQIWLLTQAGQKGKNEYGAAAPEAL